MGVCAGGQSVVCAKARQEASSALLLPARAPAPAQVAQTCMCNISLINPAHVAILALAWLKLDLTHSSLSVTGHLLTAVADVDDAEELLNNIKPYMCMYCFSS